MPRVLHINTVIGIGSTGRIMNMIHKEALKRGWQSLQVYGRDSGGIDYSSSIRTGSKASNYFDVFKSRLFDNQGLNSRKQTAKLVRFISEYNPDVVHLHNLHGYYLNYPILFECLRNNKIRVIWTLHDAWALTGHCTHFDFVECEKWKTTCDNCELTRSYPKSLWLDRSNRNHKVKKQYFNIDSLTLVSVSNWLNEFVKQSHLGSNKRLVVHNGVDIDVFRPNPPLSKVIFRFDSKVKYILAVASPWSEMKGFNDVVRISEVLDTNNIYKLIVVGVSDKQRKQLPGSCIAIPKTNNIEELAWLYANASVFINPTYEDNFPTTNLEALACGTPVVTYDTGGCKEALNPDVGEVVSKGKWEILLNKATFWANFKNGVMTDNCRSWALENFDSRKVYEQYIDIYNNSLKYNSNDK